MYCRPVIWPTLQEELADYLSYFQGRVLNAGAGNRDISGFIDGKVYNLDLPVGIHNQNIHLMAALESVPVRDSSFDAIICNAVLEHVENPDSILSEFHRILKDGGYLYICVPFMQPEHKDPKDFRRYTKDGLRKLAEDYLFSVIKIEAAHSVYHTLGWIIHEWLSSRRCFSYFILKLILYPILLFKTKFSRIKIDKIASAYRILARK